MFPDPFPPRSAPNTSRGIKNRKNDCFLLAAVQIIRALPLCHQKLLNYSGSKSSTPPKGWFQNLARETNNDTYLEHRQRPEITDRLASISIALGYGGRLLCNRGWRELVVLDAIGHEEVRFMRMSTREAC